ncbi:MAG: glycoside hydrolase family 127 protein [Pirellulales bacterium]|nr:glycoside hydrolase family 127 protein [Pirellulales bacterium]
MKQIIRTRGFFAASLIFLCALAAEPPSALGGDALTPVELGKVEVGGEIGRRIDVTLRNNLLKIDAEKDFLAPFRAKSARGGYIGLGKLIDSAVRLAAYGNDPRATALKIRLIEETIETQEPDGYIGRMAAPARMWNLWDVHEMAYIITGLVADHRFFDAESSLRAARRLADYILARWETMPEDWDRRTGTAAHVSFTGLEGAMLALHRETGERRYLDFCVRRRALPDWDLGIVVGRRRLIEGHVYAYLARCLAQLDLFRLRPDEKLLRPTRRAVRFMTERDGMCITGGVGLWEIWTDDQDGRGALGETCATAYQLRVLDGLLRLEGDSRCGDLMERTILNALFAAQSPDGRKIRYYTPLEGDRTYFPKDTYCCPCNYRRIIAELPTMIYYRFPGGLAINLYTASEAALELDDGTSLKVGQETDYPNSGRVAIRLDPSRPAKFAVRLRIPSWCKGASATVNGKRWTSPAAAGKFLLIEREWKSGDQIAMDMPMTWRLVLGRKRQSGRAAVMRGPVVFCLNPQESASLRGRDAADLGAIVIDPDSIELRTDGGTFRPGGVACSLRATDVGHAKDFSHGFSLRLTEFPDPDGKVVYFRLPDLSRASADELLSGE